MDLFNQFGTRTSVAKTVTMVCQNKPIDEQKSDSAYGRRMTGKRGGAPHKAYLYDSVWGMWGRVDHGIHG